MQRLFSMFPPGRPGVALVFLRLTVGLALLLALHAAPQGLSGWTYGVVVVVSVTLCAGWLTPLAAFVALASHAVLWARSGVDDVGFIAITSLDALALALLGPGAYSIDAYRFGRRVVVVPPFRDGLSG